MKKVIHCIIVGIGLIQIIGFIINSPLIRGIGMATASSPLPLVFTKVRGLETFASDFFICYEKKSDLLEEIKITPNLYAKFSGPYNRRNVYGAALAYGPILPERLLDSVLNYAFCKQVLSKELKLPASNKGYFVKVKSNTKGSGKTWLLHPKCN